MTSMNEAGFSWYPLEVQANTLAVDSTGTYALLGCRRELVLVNLKDLTAKEPGCTKRFALQSKIDPTAIQWHPSEASYFITALNTGVIWSLQDKQKQIRRYTYLRGFSRGISALDWNPNDTNLIATTSLCRHQAVSVWDFRDTKKHIISAESIAGATQVRWNRVKANVFATAHESTVRLWDIRNSRAEWSSIAAHVAKISDLDWSPLDEHELVTAGQECKLKVWNVRHKEHCLAEASSNGIPFSKARYAPFGRALVTQPSALKRADTGVVLWSLNGASSGTDSMTVVRCFETFPSASYAVALDWRRSQTAGGLGMAPQIVAWSSDHTLNLWSISEELQEQCGVITDVASSPGRNGPNCSTPEKASAVAAVQFVVGSFDSPDTEATVTPPPPTQNSEVGEGAPVHDRPMGSPEHPRIAAVNGDLDMGHHGHAGHLLRRTPSSGGARSLFHELQQLMHALEGDHRIDAEELDASVRRCRFAIQVKALKLHLEIAFPAGYPNGVMPTFRFLPPRPNWDQSRLHKTLQELADDHVSQSRGCVELCLRHIVQELEMMQRPEEASPFDDDVSNKFYASFGLLSLQDTRGYAPMPRMVVARFSKCGTYLVCFRRAPIAGECASTPWALLDLQGPQVQYTVAASPPGSGTLDSASESGRAATPRRVRHMRPTGRRALSQNNPVVHAAKHKPQSGLVTSPSGSMPNAGPDPHPFRLPAPVMPSPDIAPASPEVVRSGGPQVFLYDVTRLSLVSRRMAEEYRLGSGHGGQTEAELDDLCQHNAKVASLHARPDLVQIWKGCRILCSPALRPSLSPKEVPPWALLPFGRRLVESWISHYSALRDIQTLGMLANFLKNLEVLWQLQPLSNDVELSNGAASDTGGDRLSSITLGRRRTAADEESLLKQLRQQYHTITAYDANHRLKMILGLKEHISRPRSCSWSEQCDDNLPFDREDEQRTDPLLERHRENCRLFSTATSRQMDEFLRCYGDLLYVWDLLPPRARLLKVLRKEPEDGLGDLVSPCASCFADVPLGRRCLRCLGRRDNDKPPSRRLCSICREPVIGLTAMCELCGHQGHFEHMAEWFRISENCPRGCGCRCKMI